MGYGLGLARGALGVLGGEAFAMLVVTGGKCFLGPRLMSPSSIRHKYRERRQLDFSLRSDKR